MPVGKTYPNDAAQRAHPTLTKLRLGLVIAKSTSARGTVPSPTTVAAELVDLGFDGESVNVRGQWFGRTATRKGQRSHLYAMNRSVSSFVP